MSKILKIAIMCGAIVATLGVTDDAQARGRGFGGGFRGGGWRGGGWGGTSVIIGGGLAPIYDNVYDNTYPDGYVYPDGYWAPGSYRYYRGHPYYHGYRGSGLHRR